MVDYVAGTAVCFQAHRSAYAWVVLVGDPNQLSRSSVGAGNVFYELIHSGTGALSRYYGTEFSASRKDGLIALQCKFINEGQHQSWYYGNDFSLCSWTADTNR